MPKKLERPKTDYRVKILRFLIVALVLAMGYNLAVSQYGFINMYHLRKQIDDLKTEELAYNVKLVDLEYKRDRLKSDSLYLEQLARKKYQFQRPGETVIEY